MSTPDTTSVEGSQAPAERPATPGSGKGRGIARAIGLGLITGRRTTTRQLLETYASAGGPTWAFLFVDCSRHVSHDGRGCISFLETLLDVSFKIAATARIIEMTRFRNR